MIKKVKEMIRILERDGWYLHSQVGVIGNINTLVKKGESPYLIMEKMMI